MNNLYTLRRGLGSLEAIFRKAERAQIQGRRSRQYTRTAGRSPFVGERGRACDAGPHLITPCTKGTVHGEKPNGTGFLLISISHCEASTTIPIIAAIMTH